MNIEIITIGDEILIGQIVDTNSAWIAQQLNLIGASVKQISSVSDDKQHIVEALNEAKDRADVILITGGLGPTKDDITKNTLCEYFSCGLVFNEDVYKDVERMFHARGLEVTALNRKQAEVPDKCKVLRNELGTAAGMWFEEAGKIFVSMPGVPYEMKAMMLGGVLPKLKEKFKMPHIVHKTVLTQGIGESFLSEKINDWEESLKSLNIKLAYLPSPGVVRLRLSTKGSDEKMLIKNVDDKINELRKIVPEYISGMEVYGAEKQGPQHIVGELLTSKNKTLATAESCTGGYIAHLVTTVPGSSRYFLGTVVSYADDVKINLLGVNPDDIKKYGAVSQTVVEQMAVGVRKLIGTDYALATSGIAGPGGATPGKPVGTEWVALATATKVISQQFLFGDDRERNIRKAALAAFEMLRKEMIAGL